MIREFLRRQLQDLLMWNEMPSDLVLVRHLESEGNKLKDLSPEEQVRYYAMPEFANRHSSQWRGTRLGRAQATSAGIWIRQNILPKIPNGRFFRHYCSSYIRAVETAGILDLDGPWMESFYLRERDWGYLDVMSREERKIRFAAELMHMERNKFLNGPPNGESMAGLCLRADRVNNTFSRECARMPVIVVCHGEWMWAERVLLERFPMERYQELEGSKNPYDKIHNCQILWYSRRHPETGRMQKRYGWVRSVCPWDLSLSSNLWKPIVRPVYYDHDLIARAEKVPQIIF